MAKRLFDIIFSLLAILLSFPLLVLISVLIRMVDGKPIFFRSRRVGRHGVPFDMLKFRSMIVNAEIMGSGAIPLGDPRVTPVGRILRLTKIDELPQFVNILKGDMSFVGPRPELLKYAGTFEGIKKPIIENRPGLTDWATIVDIDEGALLRGAVNPDEEYEKRIRPVKIKLQLRYIAEASLWLDLKLLAYTAVKLVVRHWLPTELRDFRDSILADSEGTAVPLAYIDSHDESQSKSSEY